MIKFLDFIKIRRSKLSHNFLNNYVFLSPIFVLAMIVVINNKTDD